MWPADVAELAEEQRRIAAVAREDWTPKNPSVAGCFVCFERGGRGAGAAGERGWAAAATLASGRVRDESVLAGEAGGPYAPGLLAVREGPLLQAAVTALAALPDVLLVNATGLDHPRRAGLALHLGAVLDLPTVGVTHRPLLALGDLPGPQRGARTPLRIGSDEVGCWLRILPGVRPLAVHAAWRTSLETAVEVILGLPARARTPEPLRRARHLARTARAEETA